MSSDNIIRERYKIPKTVTVEIDTREQYPIRFPAYMEIINPENITKRLKIKVVSKKIKLDTGDYRLAEYPNCCIIERKAGQRELNKNLFHFKDAVRQAKSFRRLAKCEYPCILVEVTPAEILRANPHVQDTEALLHRLAFIFAKYGVHVLWIPWRHRKRTSTGQLGLFLVHLMLGFALKKDLEILPEALK